MRIVRTDSSDQNFIELVGLLDEELAKMDGKDHAYYAQFNTIDTLEHIILIYQDEKAIACGAIKPFNDHSVEIKRMYTRIDSRGCGLASEVIKHLEIWALELGYDSCCLETGKRQPEAMSLYKTNGYRTIENYGQYAGIDNSVCFKKSLKNGSD